MSSARNTPILFLIFNRPDTTAQVFSAIAKARPRYLFIAADGPRQDKDGEVEKCEKTRGIINRVDWECDVKILIRDTNLGCKSAVSSAITWFFEHVEAGIILEDDCLPSDTFFSFCTELLEKYVDDERVMMISGDNFQDGIERGNASYYFSEIPWIWGWATWRRAWFLYDQSMSTFPVFVKENRMQNISNDIMIQNYRWKCFVPVYEGRIDTWDYQWIYTILINKSLSICPQVNLVKNIGFSSEATHTCSRTSKFSCISTNDIYEIKHPWTILPDIDADYYFYNKYLNIFCNRTKNPVLRWRKILKKNLAVKKMISKFLATLKEGR